MKKPFNYLLAGLLALLGFSSCSALREAREAREMREREAFERQQRELVEQTLQEMLEADASACKPEAQVKEEKVDSIRDQRIRVLYGTRNVPYRELEEN